MDLIEIVRMEPWMIPGMAELHVLQYGGDLNQEVAKFTHRFASPFSRNRGAIVLVGLSGERVVAMQTYTPWPYRVGGQSFRSLQSGATLVHLDFRGRKLFQRMLAEGTRIATDQGDDFFMGFPVQMSYGGFIKDNWSDMGRLRWWTKPLRPVRLVTQRLKRQFSSGPLTIGEVVTPEALRSHLATRDGFTLSNEDDFLQWRYGNSESGKYRLIRYSKGDKQVGFVVKANQSHGFHELLVGEIRSNEWSSVFLAKGLADLCREARLNPEIAGISLAVLSPQQPLQTALLLNGFIPNKFTAPLIIKPLLQNPGLTEPERWRGTNLEHIDAW